MAMAATAIAQDASDPEVRVTGSAGWGGRFEGGAHPSGEFRGTLGQARRHPGVARAGRWFPVWVEVQNLRQKDELDGEISIEPAGPDTEADRKVSTRARLLVAPQQSVRVLLFHRLWNLPFPEAGVGGLEGLPSPSRPVRLSVSLVDRKTGRAPRGGTIEDITVRGDAWSSCIAVVGGTEADPVAKSLGPLVLPHAQAARIAPDDLPDALPGYDSLDVLVWPRLEGEGPPREVTEALAAWIRAGGTLVVGLGPAARPGGPLRALLPAGIGETVELPVLHCLASLADPGDTGAPFPAATGPETLRLLAPAAGAEVLASEELPSGRIPVVIRRRIGAGEVVLAGLDLSSASFRGAAGTPLWRGLLRTPAPLKRADGRGFRSPLPETLAGTLKVEESEKEVPFGILALFLLGYVVLIGPVDYWILRGLNRLEWTFGTFAVVTVAMTAVAWYTSQQIKGGEMRFRALEVVTRSVGSPGGRSETLLGLYVPRNQSYQVRPEPPLGAAGLFWAPADERQALGRAFAVERDGPGVRVSRADIRIWTVEWFHAVRSDGESAPVQATLRDLSGELTGTVTTLANRPLRSVVLLYRDRVWRLDDMLPSRPVAVVPFGGLPWDPAAPEPVRSRLAIPPEAPPQGLRRGGTEEAASHLDGAKWLVLASLGAEPGDPHPWTRGLRVRPRPGEAVLMGIVEGDAPGVAVAGDTPRGRTYTVLRVLVPVERP
ncbi:MAG: hypothetical protein L0216_21710 [Planctomycetales bacterium]|nr:hypothetical protein [Planctomycetales bacterium]